MTTPRSATSAASNAIRGSSGSLVTLGRLGYVAKGIVYIVIGFLSTEAALGLGGKATDTRGAIRVIGESPFGKIALIVIAVGLLGYAAWRLVSAATDAEQRGDQASSIAMRAGDAFRGLAYGSLGIWTLKLLTHKAADDGNKTPSMVAKLMKMPGGRFLVIAVGLAFIGYAIYQIYKATTDKFMKRLNVTPEAKTWVERFGRFGIVARAIVFGMIGVLIIRAGKSYDPSKAGGIAQSLNAIAREPKGHILFAIVAIGLIAFGLFQIATAKYRTMRAS